MLVIVVPEGVERFAMPMGGYWSFLSMSSSTPVTDAPVSRSAGTRWVAAN